MKTVAIVLAAGSGSRMKTEIKKQYLSLGTHPILWYSLKVFQDCPRVDEIELVCGANETKRCREEFVERYGFSKIQTVTEGGRERYDSVYAGLKAIKDCDFVLIHDSARPFVSEELLERILDALQKWPACVPGMPVKDTIKASDPDGFVEQTLPRERLWAIQTPQAFAYPLIRRAYDILAQSPDAALSITDDAMVAEQMLHTRVKLVEGSYGNIKITTPEDLILAEEQLKKSVDRNSENC